MVSDQDQYKPIGSSRSYSLPQEFRHFLKLLSYPNVPHLQPDTVPLKIVERRFYRACPYNDGICDQTFVSVLLQDMVSCERCAASFGLVNSKPLDHTFDVATMWQETLKMEVLDGKASGIHKL